MAGGRQSAANSLTAELEQQRRCRGWSGRFLASPFDSCGGGGEDDEADVMAASARPVELQGWRIVGDGGNGEDAAAVREGEDDCVGSGPPGPIPWEWSKRRMRRRYWWRWLASGRLQMATIRRGARRWPRRTPARARVSSQGRERERGEKERAGRGEQVGALGVVFDLQGGTTGRHGSSGMAPGPWSHSESEGGER